MRSPYSSPAAGSESGDLRRWRERNMNASDALRILRQIRLLAILITTLLLVTVFCNIYAILPSRTLPSTPESFEDTASRLMSEGKYSEVVALAEREKELHPQDPYAWWYLGVGFYALGSWRDAIQAFDKTQDLAPLWEERACSYIARAQGHLSNTNQETSERKT